MKFSFVPGVALENAAAKNPRAPPPNRESQNVGRATGSLRSWLGIGDADFDEMAHLLNESLTQHRVGPDDRAEVMRKIEARRGVIVSRVGE